MSIRACRTDLYRNNKKVDQTRWRFEERTRDTCSIVVDQTDDQQSQERIVIHNVYNCKLGVVVVYGLMYEWIIVCMYKCVF